MSWWYILGLVAAVAFIWLLTRPVRREVQRADFAHWFRELLVNSKKGAWLEIADTARNSSLMFQKLDRAGQELSIELVAPEGNDGEEAALSMQETWEGAELACPPGRGEDAKVTLLVLLASPDAVGGAAQATSRFFDATGSAPGCRFRLRAKGRTDPEALRPIAESMQHRNSGKSSKAWGKALGKSLDRHRDRR